MSKEEIKFSETARYLVDRYGGIYMTPDEVAKELGWKSGRSVINAISAQRLPIPSRKVGGRRVVDVRDMATFLDEKQKAAS